MRLLSSITVEEVGDEVRSVFKKPMNGRRDFPFKFLQPTGAGSRTLTVPSVSASFSWTAQQVAKLGTVNQAVYIMAKDNLIEESEVNMYVCKQSVQLRGIYIYNPCFSLFFASNRFI